MLALGIGVHEPGEPHRPRSVVAVGLTGALISVATLAVLYLREKPVPEAELPAPPGIQFTGPGLSQAKPDATALRLRNFMAACAAGDTFVVAQFIDPTSKLAGQPAPCGPVTSITTAAPSTTFRFDRVDVDRDRATVYVTVMQPAHEGERYTFFMRKVEGRWYLSLP